ncbi:MAG: oligosaccharide flippase family protein [Terriglobales bacterium]
MTPTSSQKRTGFARLYSWVREYVDRLLRGENLRAKTTRGAVLLGSASVSEQASRFARNMLLARLLAPSAFGTMALVMSSASIVGSLTDVGVRVSVIRNPRGREAAYLNAAWWLAMGRGLGVYAICFLMAPLVARFYGNVELSALLRVALLGAVLEGAMSPRSCLPQKDMKFGRWAAITNGGAICGVIFTVILSFILRDVWALAIGYCSENVFRCLLSYILCPGLPSFGWDRDAARDLLSYSRGAYGLSFLNLIFTRTDIFVLAKLYSPTALGLYTMAVYLVQTPTGFIQNMVGSTLLPAFAHVQEDDRRINRVLLEATSWLIVLGLPVVVVIWLYAPFLLRVIYGARYLKSAGPLSVAAAVACLSILNGVITDAFSAMGRPALHRRAVAASAVIMIVAIYPACKMFGVVGGQIAALFAIGASYFLQIMRIRELTSLDLARYGKAFVLAGLVSAALLCCGLGIRFLGLAAGNTAQIALVLCAFLLAYGICVPAVLRAKGDA